MAAKKSAPQKPFLVARTHTLTREADILLQQLSQEASDALGWTVGSSAIVRALLRYVAQQPTSWAPTTLHPLIEKEIDAGIVWGSKKK
jgi:hypothetical protein